MEGCSSMIDEGCKIQVDGGDAYGRYWTSRVKSDLNKLTQIRWVESKRWENQSISRIPWSVKEVRPSAYQPQMVSIGPYHHGQIQLESMEEHKHRAFLNFLHRSGKPLQCYVDALAPVAEDLMDAYTQLEHKWKQNTEVFLHLMIVDGCFILELLRATTSKSSVALIKMGYAHNDPVFSNHGRLCFAHYLMRDMLMLENQLPLLLLPKLLVAEVDQVTEDGLSSKRDQLTALILEFFSQPYNEGNKEKYRTCLHILDMYRKSLLGRVPRNRVGSWLRVPVIRRNEDVYIRSTATELTEAGVRFQRSKTRKLNDISFCDGVLKLPLIIVDDALESEYLNLMAFERFHMGTGSEVTSYVCFMQYIIGSARDVSLLRSRHIIQNTLGSDKAAANLFSNLRRDGGVDPASIFAHVYEEVADYCRSPLPRWMAYARYNYFTNPWITLSIVGAIFLFLLTAFQTAYSIVAYYHTK